MTETGPERETPIFNHWYASQVFWFILALKSVVLETLVPTFRPGGSQRIKLRRSEGRKRDHQFRELGLERSQFSYCFCLSWFLVRKLFPCA